LRGTDAKEGCVMNKLLYKEKRVVMSFTDKELDMLRSVTDPSNLDETDFTKDQWETIDELRKAFDRVIR
jgi:hypothetical protein